MINFLSEGEIVFSTTGRLLSDIGRSDGLSVSCMAEGVAGVCLRCGRNRGIAR